MKTKLPQPTHINEKPVLYTQDQIKKSLERRGFAAQRHTLNKVQLLNGLIKVANYISQTQNEGENQMPFLIARDLPRLKTVFAVMLPSCGAWECEKCLSQRNDCLRKTVAKFEDIASSKFRRKTSIKELVVIPDKEVPFDETTSVMLNEFKRLLLDIGGGQK